MLPRLKSIEVNFYADPFYLDRTNGFNFKVIVWCFAKSAEFAAESVANRKKAQAARNEIAIRRRAIVRAGQHKGGGSAAAVARKKDEKVVPSRNN